MPNIKNEQEDSAVDVPTTVSESTVRRRLLNDAAHHPLTTVGFGCSAISGIYLLILAPVFGADSVAALALIISGVVTLSNLAYQYVTGHGNALSVLLEDEGNERIRQREACLRRRQDSLQTDFVALEHTEGTAALNRLAHEYERLQPVLVDQDQIGILSVPQIEHLTKETYRRGLSVLADSITLIEAIENPGIGEIAAEISALEIEIEALRTAGKLSDRISIKENVLASQRTRLKELEQLQVHVDELLYQSHRCQISLNRTRIDLAAISAGSSNSGVNAVIGALEGTIQRAKEVQEELKNLGY